MSVRLALLVVALLVSCDVAQVDEGTNDLATRLRRPAALVLADNDTRLYVANRASGTLSIVDLATGSMAGETQVGHALADLAITPDEQFLVAVDELADQLIAIERGGDALVIVARTAIPKTPVSVRMSQDGDRAFVASLWARALTVVDLSGVASGQTSHRIIKTIELPFSPRAQCLVADGTRLIVADAFGGSLGVIDTQALELMSVRQLPGHNLRGLALSPDGRQLLVAHQVLNSNVETSQRNVFWGAVMSNVVRALPIDDLLAPSGEPLPAPSAFTPGTLAIGGLGSGAGDPGPLAVTSAGDIIIALGGVREVAVRRAGQAAWVRETSGRRPAAIALSADERRAFVANSLSDSIAVIDLVEVEREQTILLGPQPELAVAERGEQLFYDARLSFDGWFSCHSCHTDGHSNGLVTDNFGDGSAGAPKRVLSLLGTADTGPWAWDGHVQRLEDQVRSSLTATMRSRNITDENVTALAAFLRTLPPPPAADTSKAGDDLVATGRVVFDRAGCSGCHQGTALTSGGAYDVGLTDELGKTRFNPPSLRGVRLQRRLFHDSRAASLDEVIYRLGHGTEEKLSAQDAGALLAYLRGL